MTTWNIRILKTEHDGEQDFMFIEVFYDNDGNIVAYSDEAKPFGESLEELAASLEYHREAFNRPVLTIDDIPKNGH